MTEWARVARETSESQNRECHGKHDENVDEYPTLAPMIIDGKEATVQLATRISLEVDTMLTNAAATPENQSAP